jgi:hypothetical protein
LARQRGSARNRARSPISINFGWKKAQTAGQRTGNLPDPDDAPFLECARTAGVPLVTGNLRHFPKSVAGKVPVLTPAQFVASLEK